VRAAGPGGKAERWKTVGQGSGACQLTATRSRWGGRLHFPGDICLKSPLQGSVRTRYRYREKTQGIHTGSSSPKKKKRLSTILLGNGEVKENKEPAQTKGIGGGHSDNLPKETKVKVEEWRSPSRNKKRKKTVGYGSGQMQRTDEEGGGKISSHVILLQIRKWGGTDFF